MKARNPIERDRDEKYTWPEILSNEDTMDQRGSVESTKEARRRATPPEKAEVTGDSKKMPAYAETPQEPQKDQPSQYTSLERGGCPRYGLFLRALVKKWGEDTM
ncbi:hypothetical protein NDU88_002020 [Pleurodeles waltl]|uniref:Uncharacterized protein n=1 Tax=Pleurodeles waltl TaxID=8319 RepID=A0AAV7MLG8_PLEWA|nr:hypothetical protein NDU88_002020 [Pleurodeles waltl]